MKPKPVIKSLWQLTEKPVLCLITILLPLVLMSQDESLIPDLSQISDPEIWTLHNRELLPGAEIHLDARPGDGMLYLQKPFFSNAEIELEIRGQNIRGRSFVGLAFHGQNDTTFDAVYFRPFNFKDPDRNLHSVQYISHPIYTWSKLRKEHPDEYENSILPAPEPNDWFHVKIRIEYPQVRVFVNKSKTASLHIKQISKNKSGWIGFWVGNNSEGFFRNLKITPL